MPRTKKEPTPKELADMERQRQRRAERKYAARKSMGGGSVSLSGIWVPRETKELIVRAAEVAGVTQKEIVIAAVEAFAKLGNLKSHKKGGKD